MCRVLLVPLQAVVMRAACGLHLLLQGRQRLLRLGQVARFQGIADLVERLRKRAVWIAAGDLAQR
jgi:hypothetical protein